MYASVVEIRLRRLGLLGGCPQVNLPYRMLYGTLRCFWFVDSSLRTDLSLPDSSLRTD